MNNLLLYLTKKDFFSFSISHKRFTEDNTIIIIDCCSQNVFFLKKEKKRARIHEDSNDSKVEISYRSFDNLVHFHTHYWNIFKIKFNHLLVVIVLNRKILITNTKM